MSKKGILAVARYCPWQVTTLFSSSTSLSLYDPLKVDGLSHQPQPEPILTYSMDPGIFNGWQMKFLPVRSAKTQPVIIR